MGISLRRPDDKALLTAYATATANDRSGDPSALQKARLRAVADVGAYKAREDLHTALEVLRNVADMYRGLVPTDEAEQELHRAAIAQADEAIAAVVDGTASGFGGRRRVLQRWSHRDTPLAPWELELLGIAGGPARTTLNDFVDKGVAPPPE